MHSVPRSTEPDYWEQLKAERQHWEEVRSQERVLIRDSLVGDFGPICAYCERPCHSQGRPGSPSDAETIDHFRPRSLFPGLCLEWLNLVYACYRCNQRKGNQWPGFDDAEINRRLTAHYTGKYVTPAEYVNPNWTISEKPVREYFAFDVNTGAISPAEGLDATEWSMALRTILDIDLNDSYGNSPGESEPTHLWNRRLTHLNLLANQLIEIDDLAAQISIVRQFMAVDKPFSGFIAAWVDERFGTLPSD